MNETLIIKIELVDGKYPYVEADPRMPFMLADQIKEVIKDFYKED